MADFSSPAVPNGKRPSSWGEGSTIPGPFFPKSPVPSFSSKERKVKPGGFIDLNRIQSLIPDCKRRLVKDAGHLIPMERPREMTRIIGEFFFPAAGMMTLSF